jgi:hypothetical protein
MLDKKCTRIVIACLSSTLSLALRAAGPATAPATQPSDKSTVAELLDFSPTASDAPSRLTAGVARSGGRDQTDPTFDFEILVPPGSYASATTSPTLFWYTTKPTPRPFRITLVDDQQAKVYEAEYRDPLCAGIQRLDLSKVGVKLTPGKRYKWMLEFFGPASGNVDTSRKSVAYLQVLPPDNAAVTELSKLSEPSQRIRYSAEHRLWYDFLAAAQEQIDRDPADSQLRQWRDKQIKSWDLLGDLQKRGETK